MALISDEKFFEQCKKITPCETFKVNKRTNTNVMTDDDDKPCNNSGIGITYQKMADKVDSINTGNSDELEYYESNSGFIFRGY